eukprot:TRINITY_DN12122_c0_g1_i2.p1 TRINITY_DN12122_c0_g1~~TRINITY_DN12122_c0_g1_i2.p1  ORF type:complete len:124 (-),score=15.76 TRINITY_DN12122_c0_g1_i2:68-439(-)
MFRRLIFLAARESNIGEAAELGPAKVLVRIIRDHGPVTSKECWAHAEAAGVKSKHHMKKVLSWLKERDHVQVLCQHDAKHKGSKEFFFRIHPSKEKLHENSTLEGEQQSTLEGEKQDIVQESS